MVARQIFIRRPSGQDRNTGPFRQFFGNASLVKGMGKTGGPLYYRCLSLDTLVAIGAEMES